MAKSKEIKTDSAWCITPKFRVSFPQVFKAKSFNDGPEKFSITMLFDEKTDLTALRAAHDFVISEKFGEDKKKWPKNMRSPFRDGSEKSNLQGYDGCIFVTASSTVRPSVIDRDKSSIAEGDNSFYAGCYARASIRAFYYDQMGNKGVSFGLENIQKMADGEEFSGRKKAEDVFDEVEDSSDDESSYGKDSSDDDL